MRNWCRRARFLCRRSPSRVISNDMGIGNDVAVGIDDDAGSDGLLAGDERSSTLAALFDRTVARDQDLNHGWGNASGELLDRCV